MGAAVVCAVGLLVLWAGYAFYSRFLAERVFELRSDEPVPARELEDGVDFVPTAKAVLFGHHYSSIAGAAPIIGPAIAVVWGWVPAMVWVVLGSVFMGAMHDFSVLVLSMRKRGQSIGQLSAEIISPRARTLFLLIVFFLVMLVIAVFARAIAKLFVAYPGTVLPINFQIVVAVTVGWLCYKRRVRLLGPSVVSLLVLYGMVYVGTLLPLSIAGLVGAESELTVWVVALLVYSFVASVLPVWILLQPRDYVNSHQLFVGLFALIAGIFVANPTIVAPAFNAAPADAPSWMPFLFVTIACGAISGFHGLVSSGTTSKQLARATDARAIGYGSMLGEGLLAMIATLAVSAGLADWSAHYHSFSSASAGGVKAFVQGAATFLVPLGVPREPGQVVIAVMVISFAATSLDTGVRIQRYILQELAETYELKALGNRYVAGFVAVFLPLILFLAKTDGKLWPLFGATNQILAGMSLVVVTTWLYRARRPWLPAGIPMLLVLLVAGSSMIINLGEYLEQGNYLLLVLGGVILALEVWLVLEAVRAVREASRQGAVEPPVGAS